ncbi:MAG TPA: HAD family phosphatase [Pyrinomonadaceae bacterium]|nr:HAD family phosphatase [Pyrinomonadaceae bacterium]
MGNPQRESARATRAVLWDVDGTLIDSAEYHWLTWRETLLGEGYELTRAQFDASFGRRNDEILRGYFGENLSAAEVARIGEAKEVRYRELVGARGIEPLPGVRRWLGKLKTEGWRQALASSAPRLNLEAILKALGLEDFFDAIASAEDVERGKPDPQIFLAAAAKVQVPAAGCVVVEDAPAGIEAARRAEMRSIGVLSFHGELDADVVVRSLADLPDDTFDRLLLRR